MLYWYVWIEIRSPISANLEHNSGRQGSGGVGSLCALRRKQGSDAVVEAVRREAFEKLE
jgi:hypothetical protein